MCVKVTYFNMFKILDEEIVKKKINITDTKI